MEVVARWMAEKKTSRETIHPLLHVEEVMLALKARENAPRIRPLAANPRVVVARYSPVAAFVHLLPS